jgi:hypothetical protein
MRELAPLARGDEFARRAKPRREDGLEAARHRLQGDVAFMRRALALQQVDMQFPVEPESELNAKWRRGRFMFRRCRSAQEDWTVAGEGAHLQASNLLLPCLG